MDPFDVFGGGQQAVKEAAEQVPVPDEQEDGDRPEQDGYSGAVQLQEEGQSCFERDHQTGQVQFDGQEKQAAEMAAKEEAIGVLEVFSVVRGY